MSADSLTGFLFPAGKLGNFFIRVFVFTCVRLQVGNALTFYMELKMEIKVQSITPNYETTGTHFLVKVIVQEVMDECNQVANFSVSITKGIFTLDEIEQLAINRVREFANLIQLRHE